MFDIGMSEVLVIAVVSLVAIGPKDLPGVLRATGRWVGRARVLAGEFHRHLNDMVREAELEEVQRKVEQFGRTDVNAAIANTVDPDGTIPRGLELPELEAPETVGTPDATTSPEAAPAPASSPLPEEHHGTSP
ncbi:MAG: Sec-independent protein translocase protein TatB [Alphaproteobacteria bacterium]